MNIKNSTKTISSYLRPAARLFPFAAATAFFAFAALAAGGPSGPRSVQIAVVGDMMFDRGVRDAISRDGASALFSGYAAALAGADLTIGNLECPVAAGGRALGGRNSFRCDPAIAGALAAAGFDAVSVANNHTLDLGPGGLARTRDNLRAAGVQAFGSPAGAGGGPAVIEKNGLKIALLGFNVFGGGVDAASVRGAVSDARKTADAAVVYFHWGNEFSREVSAAQADLSRAAIEGGAALVAGAHPHVLQRTARSGGSLTAYSLGNFIFDQTRGGANETAMLTVEITPMGAGEYRFLPGIIKGGRPAPATGASADQILARLMSLAGAK